MRNLLLNGEVEKLLLSYSRLTDQFVNTCSLTFVQGILNTDGRTMIHLTSRRAPHLLYFALLALALSTVHAQNASALDGAKLLAISKPPLAILETDPASAIMTLQSDLSTTGELFTAGEGVLGEALSLEYICLKEEGTALLSFDVGATENAPGGLLVIPGFREQSPGEARYIHGPTTGLDQPKGLVVDAELGVINVADFGTNTVKGFDIKAEGDAAPLFNIADLGQTSEGEPRQPWDLDVDAAQQRLFVATTDGVILVYNDYLLTQGEGGPDRVIVPTLDGERASANLHGITYLSERDTLIVSDFGPAKDSDEPGFDTDGKLFVIENASGANGDTEVKAQLAGPNSGLGNPSDLTFDGSALYVGDKVLDAVLRFDDILSLSGAVDPTPTGAVTVIKPESLVLLD